MEKYQFDPKIFNAQQREAVLHTTGPILVLAGAGSGKTRIIAHRVAQLIHGYGALPSQIVALSFTNKAANEMKERVAQLIGAEAARATTLSTFHALGANILRHHLQRLGWIQPFAILDEADAKILLKNCLKDLNLDGSRLDLSWVLSFISRVKASNLAPLDLPGMRYNPQGRTLAKIFDHYQLMRKNMNAVDFDDMICLAYDIFEQFPEILEKYQERWQFFLVDEYQDTNAPQFRLISQLCAKRPNLMVVGDDDQSIYAFRGADSSHILNFPKHFQNVRVIALEQNYRSTKNILMAANNIISKNATRHAKALWCEQDSGEKLRHFFCKDENDEAHFVVEQIQLLRALKDLNYADFAILYRSKLQSRPIELALTEEGIAYRIVGASKLFDRREIKDLLYYLRAIWSPNDGLALRRIINSPRRGLTAKHLNNINEMAKSQGLTYFESLKLSVEKENYSDAVEMKVTEFIRIIERFHHIFAEKKHSLKDACLLLIEELHYLSYIQSTSSNDAQALMRKRNIEDFLASLEAHELRAGRDLFLFLQQIALEPPQREEKQGNDELTLMTLHASKGLEFPYVFIVGCEEGMLPHTNALQESGGLEEERRLMYVGVTRAKRGLCISSCQTRQSRGDPITQSPSRFLKDISKDFIEDSQKADSEAAKKLALEQEERNRYYLKAMKAAIFGPQD